MMKWTGGEETGAVEQKINGFVKKRSDKQSAVRANDIGSVCSTEWRSR